MAKKNDWRTKVFDSLSLPALILQPDKVIVSVNRACLNKLRLTPEQVIGKTCHAFFYNSTECCSDEACPLPQLLKDKKGHSILQRVTTDGQKEKWEDRVFSPILDEQGEVEFIIESMRDVTEVKVLEKELSGVREFLEKIIESSASGIVAADMTGKILMMNRAAEDLFGYPRENNFRNLNIRDVYPPGMAKEIMRKLREEKIGGKGKLPSRTVSVVNAAGEKIPIELTAAIIYEEGREVATMGVFNDLRAKLADEERMGKMLERIDQAQKMASLGQLAAGVAHEINNPLTGIFLYANMVLEQLPQDDSKREDLKYVLEDADRCRHIVKNLLAYSRQTNPKREIFQLNALVEQSLDLIRDQKLFLNIEVVKKMSDAMMLIHADKNQLSQVVVNLVMNALDAMLQQGVLTLHTYRDKAAGRVYLEVGDTGSGIPAENIPKIFDPFFTTKEPGKGTGLGLSTVYGIIKENDGNISVKETGPQGTVFLVELPLYQPSDET